ncbi:MAG: alpha-ribazole phosphatase family protein [Pseudomonadota bacterium]
MFADDVITTVDLIRHGEPVGGRRFRGSQDDPLSEKGWQQMRNAVEHAAPWQRIVSSPLLRCRQFATELGTSLAVPVEIDNDFQEVHFGDWEGLTTAEVQAGWPGLLGKVWRDSIAHSPPGGEKLEDFQSRVAGAWESLLQSRSGEHVMLVAHGGTIRLILCHVLGVPLTGMWRFEVAYASLTRLRVWHPNNGEPPTASLLAHGAHLRDMPQ